MSERVLGVLGGDDLSDDRLRAWASSATVLYAADSGADRLIALGFSPTVVGDLDSFASLPHASHLRIVESQDEEMTDCDKMFALVKNDGHGAITMTCSEGDLPDHVLATYSSALASSLDVRFAFRRGIGWIVRKDVSVKAALGARVSLVPFVRCEGVSLEGVKWPLSGAVLEPGRRVSISNEATAEEVSATLASGAALLFLETSEVAW